MHMVRDKGLVSFSAGDYVVFQAPFIKRLSSLYVLGAFIKNELAVNAWIYIWILFSVPLAYVSVFMRVPHCFDY